MILYMLFKCAKHLTYIISFNPGLRATKHKNDLTLVHWQIPPWQCHPPTHSFCLLVILSSTTLPVFFHPHHSASPPVFPFPVRCSPPTPGITRHGIFFSQSHQLLALTEAASSPPLLLPFALIVSCLTQTCPQ